MYMFRLSYYANGLSTMLMDAVKVVATRHC